MIRSQLSHTLQISLDHQAYSKSLLVAHSAQLTHHDLMISTQSLSFYANLQSSLIVAMVSAILTSYLLETFLIDKN